MSLAGLIRDMAAAGAPPEAIALAVEAIERAQAAVDATRSAAAERKRRQRARDAERDTSRDGHGTVTGHSVTEPAPSPPPFLSPQTPQTNPPPHPHPEEITPPTCEARKARPKPRWPKDMPPLPGVTDEQWAGFIAHRTAKRQPLTPRAYDLLAKKLAGFASDEWPPGRVIDLIVERGWVAFEPAWITRETEQRNGQRSHHHRTGNGLLDAVFDAERESRAG